VSKSYDITIEQGATFSLVVEWKDPAGAAINLTGYAAAMQIRRTYGAPVLVSLTSPSGGIVIDAALGKLTLTIAASATASLQAPSQGVYDLEVSTGGTVYRLLEGKVFITPESTR
jgi:hypothetical protein